MQINIQNMRVLQASVIIQKILIVVIPSDLLIFLSEDSTTRVTVAVPSYNHVIDMMSMVYYYLPKCEIYSVRI